MSNYDDNNEEFSPSEQARDAARAELQELANHIHDWWKAQRPPMTHRKLEQRFPGISSSRTLERIKDGNVADSSLKLLADYRGVWDNIQNSQLGGADDPIYPELQPAFEVGEAVHEMLKARHSRERVVIIEGDTGRGKTRSLEILLGQMSTAVLITGDSSWSGSLTGVLRDMARAFGLDRRKERDGGESGDVDIATMPKKRLFDLLVKGINDRSRLGNGVVLLIDEGHRLPQDMAAGLNFLIDLINKCDRLYIVLAAQDTCWSRLKGKSWQEAKQLFFNRTRSRVRLGAPDAHDCWAFLRLRCGLDTKVPTWPKDVGNEIVTCAQTMGGYSFLRRLARHYSGDWGAAKKLARKEAL